jgi:GntR family transcriptional repressor for pyruvate dehydrogenase complex
MPILSANVRVKRPKRSGSGGNLTTSIIQALKQMIADGDIQHGSRLPAERDLAGRFGVNRASVRQALKALEVMGVLRQRVGDGTYLTDDASSTLNAPLDFLLLVDGITFSELYEARQIFEPELASRAARRRTADELMQLEKSVTDMKLNLKSGTLADVAACDQRFHRLIWEMAGNRVCLRMFVPLHRIMTESFAVSWTINDYTNAISAHSGIFEAIGAGDAEAARQHMIEHLDRAEYIHVSHVRQAAAAPAVSD